MPFNFLNNIKMEEYYFVLTILNSIQMLTFKYILKTHSGMQYCGLLLGKTVINFLRIAVEL